LPIVFSTDRVKTAGQLTDIPVQNRTYINLYLLRSMMSHPLDLLEGFYQNSHYELAWGHSSVTLLMITTTEQERSIPCPHCASTTTTES
jgi:hypothetical protein